MAETKLVYRINPTVAIEDFETDSLAFLCDQLRLVRLNSTARDVIRYLDGRTVQQVAQAVAQAYGQSIEDVLIDVAELLDDLEEKGIVQPHEHTITKEGT